VFDVLLPHERQAKSTLRDNHCTAADIIQQERLRVLTAIKRTLSINDAYVVDRGPDCVSCQLEHELNESAVNQRRLTEVPLIVSNTADPPHSDKAIHDSNIRGHINPLKGRGNYIATSNNMKLVHWPLMGGLLH